MLNFRFWVKSRYRLRVKNPNRASRSANHLRRIENSVEKIFDVGLDSSIGTCCEDQFGGQCLPVFIRSENSIKMRKKSNTVHKKNADEWDNSATTKTYRMSRYNKLMSNPWDFSSSTVKLKSKGNLGGTQSILTLSLASVVWCLGVLRTTVKTRPPFLICIRILLLVSTLRCGGSKYIYRCGGW